MVRRKRWRHSPAGTRARLEQPRVLVGGLGMGFTLRATLDLLPAGRNRHEWWSSCLQWSSGIAVR